MFNLRPKVNSSPSALAIISGLAWHVSMAAADRAFPYPQLCFLVVTLTPAPWPPSLCIAAFVNSRTMYHALLIAT